MKYLKNVYDQYLTDPLDQDYIIQLLNILIQSIATKTIVINGISLQFPDESIGKNKILNKEQLNIKF